MTVSSGITYHSRRFFSQMRKVLLLSLVATAVALTACSKHDSPYSNDSSYEKLLEGTWRVESTKYIYYVDGDQVFSEAVDNEVIYTFKNGKILSSEGNGTYTINEEAKTLTLNADDEEMKYNISRLDGHAMTLKARTTPDSYSNGSAILDADYSDLTIVFQRND